MHAQARTSCDGTWAVVLSCDRLAAHILFSFTLNTATHLIFLIGIRLMEANGNIYMPFKIGHWKGAPLETFLSKCCKRDAAGDCEYYDAARATRAKNVENATRWRLTFIVESQPLRQ